jgi:predicted secreted protein
MNKDVTQQVNRSIERQKATIARANLPEVEKHCLGRGASKFGERAERLRQTLESQQLAMGMNPTVSVGGQAGGLGLEQPQ